MDENNLQNQTLASEIYQDLKRELKWKNIIIIILIAVMACSWFFHIYQWSQFETVPVDSGEGGYANYVGGVNAGGIYNGEGYGTEGTEGQQ